MDVSEMVKRYEAREHRKIPRQVLVEQIKQYMGDRNVVPLAEIANALAKGDKRRRVNLYAKIRQIALKDEEFSLGLNEQNKVVLIRK